MSPLANLDEAVLAGLLELPVGSWEAADLLEAREKLGLTQAELAAAIGYDRSAMAKIEGGSASPRLVVELAMRYLLTRRPQGTRLKSKGPSQASRFREPGQPIGISETGFPKNEAVSIFLADDPAIWLRLMPEFDSGRRFSIGEFKRASTQGGLPFGSACRWVLEPRFCARG
jgi:DNA-binding XRE family transcriptional regulator